MPVRFRNNAWYIDVHFQGRRIKRKTHAQTKSEAKTIERDFLNKLERKELGFFDPKIKVLFLIKKYLEFKSPPTFSEGYFCLTKLAFKNIFRIINPKNVSEITPALLKRYVNIRSKERNAKTKEYISMRTISIEIRCLKAMLNWGVKEGIMAHNPLAGFKKLGDAGKKPLKFLTIEEINKIIDTASPTYRPIFFTYLQTGLRKKELIYLTWDNVDLENKIITVVSEDRRTGYREKTGTTRYIPITDELVSVLKNVKEQHRHLDTNLVFPTHDGKPRTNNLLRELKRQAKRVGIKKVDLHTLRHSYASHLRMQGADLEAVGKLLGHKDVKTTKIYEHLHPDFLRKTVELNPIHLSQLEKA